MHRSPSFVNDEEKQKATRQYLQEKCRQKVAKRNNKRQENLKYIKSARPEYCNYFEGWIEEAVKIRNTYP